jgi:hypothetical protein
MPLVSDEVYESCLTTMFLNPFKKTTPATQEAEIRRIVVQSQLRQIVHKTVSQKYPTQKRAGGVVQVVQCLPA